MAELSTKRHRTLILGGGIGGICAANRLRRKAPDGHEIILVNRDPMFSLAASYLWVMTGKRTPAQISRPLDRLKRRGIDVRIGDVEGIDAANRSATVAGETIAADNLVIALGAEWTTALAPGLDTHGHTFATLRGATELAERLRGLDSGRVLVVTAAPVYKCPAAPYEAALLIDAMTRERGIRDRVDIAIHAAEPAPMGVAGANVSAAVKSILSERGIDYRPGHQISEVSPGIASFADGDSQAHDLLVYMPAIKPAAVLSGTSITSENGWLSPDPNSLQTGIEGVYAIGDTNHIPLTIGKPLPRAGVFAHGQAITVADTIAAASNGTTSSAKFTGKGACFIETGNGKAGYGTGNFYAQPSPDIAVKPPSRRWHLGKVLFEQIVLRRWL